METKRQREIHGTGLKKGNVIGKINGARSFKECES